MANIEIKGIIRYCEGPISEDEAVQHVRQIASDAVHGTFGDFPPFWSDKWERPPHELVTCNAWSDRTDRLKFTFSLYLPEEHYPIYPVGIQHLIGVLAGDLFYLSVAGAAIRDVEVIEVLLPLSMKDKACKCFRDDRAHDIEAIRKSFALGEYEPLLAFSFKPRVGVRFEEFKKVVLAVLREGFHLVELDTRNLNLDDEWMDKLVSLAREASDLDRPHVTRFSPNLSVPPPVVTEWARQFMDVQADPVVIKIDGGLDGISSCQAVRSTFCRSGSGEHTDSRTPIITSYPLLRDQLRSRVPSDFFVEALSMSGADIIYIGDRPQLGHTSRTLGTAGSGRLINSVRRYHSKVERGWPMPTIAGGVHAGELQAFYELMGPNVAYFLGGAVALHKDGPVAGAKLCVRVIEQAIKLKQNSPMGKPASDLDHGLKKEIEVAYTGRGQVGLPYVSPTALLRSKPGLKTWFP